MIDEAIVQPLMRLMDGLVQAIPSILYALAVVLLGHLAAALLRRLSAHAVRAIGMDVVYRRLIQRSNLSSSDDGVSTPSEIAGFVVYWTIMLSVVLYALKLLGLSEAAILLERLIGYLPMLFVAIGLVTIGLYAAELFGRIVTATAASAQLPMPRWWGVGVQYATVGFTALAVLDYLQIATGSVWLITGILVSVVPVAAMIAFGLGGRRQAEEVIAGRALKPHISVGDAVSFRYRDQVLEGEVEELSVTMARVRVGECSYLVPYTVLGGAAIAVRASRRDASSAPGVAELTEEPQASPAPEAQASEG